MMGPPGTQAAFSFDEALCLFEREAVHGVCDTGRYRCPYYTWGEGPPLVFIHGLADAARGYAPLISFLSRHFRCIAYDQPVGGRDGARLGSYTHGDLAEDVFALLDHLKSRECYVFGSSFGSTIALAAMRARPERIRRGLFAGGFAQRALAPAETWLARMACFWPGCLRHLPFRKPIGQRALGPVYDAAVTPFFQDVTGAPPIAAVAQRALMLHQVDLRSILHEVRQPVLLICGDNDPLVGRPCEEVLLQGLPNVDRIELVHCGHLPHYSHPELLAEVVRRFVTPTG